MDIQCLLSRIPEDYTKGPWYQATIPDGDPIDGPNGDYVDTREVWHEDEPVASCANLADATLIALAPELAEAVREMAAILESVEAILDESGLIGGSTDEPFQQTEGTPIEWKARALVESWNDQDVAEADGKEIERLRARITTLEDQQDQNNDAEPPHE